MCISLQFSFLLTCYFYSHNVLVCHDQKITGCILWSRAYDPPPVVPEATTCRRGYSWAHSWFMHWRADWIAACSWVSVFRLEGWILEQLAACGRGVVQKQLDTFLHPQSG
jgi:hypothetical protein